MVHDQYKQSRALSFAGVYELSLVTNATLSWQKDVPLARYQFYGLLALDGYELNKPCWLLPTGSPWTAMLFTDDMSAAKLIIYLRYVAVERACCKVVTSS